jgi:hypothetical protein
MTAMDELSVTLEFRPRPLWRPLGLRAFARWYREARRYHGRVVSAFCACRVARCEVFINGKKRTHDA